MVNIKIYTKHYCPFCENAKLLLKSLGLDFEEILVKGDEDFLIDMSEKYSHFTVPKIFIDDKFIGGYDNLKGLRDSGELLNLIELKN